MYKVNQRVVYPGHGIGIITNVDTKSIFGKTQKFYRISIERTGMVLLCPSDEAKRLIRPVCSKKTAQDAVAILRQTHTIDNTTWNRRYREYIEIIKRGNTIEIAEVYAKLSARKEAGELSFGERKMIDCAKDLLFSELELVLKGA